MALTFDWLGGDAGRLNTLFNLSKHATDGHYVTRRAGEIWPRICSFVRRFGAQNALAFCDLK